MSAHLFATLVDLAREEHAMVTDGRYDELADLVARRDAVMALLPPVAPPEAMDHLREASRLQGLITEALRQARDATGTELRRLRTTRTGVQGYAAGAGMRPVHAGAYDHVG
ncbi:MAG TPA: hypothetical protein VGM33_01705 [Baekduia sp.]|jgi:hypothetical protein